ncbi:hypothetical protein [Moritella sp. Urea-trap-13]|uniref:hypothetical protein n=1 Tax=Moritella sp. Urea-trap-13 TaxID=2058327 RepID=UPI000C34F958|nr:hypothetical protein [Moritella sp. Urea-trap-13]PKH05324.1 hypothetical protein CXF93_18735 [Moritella sp. Urea-trap-13]
MDFLAIVLSSYFISSLIPISFLGIRISDFLLLLSIFLLIYNSIKFGVAIKRSVTIKFLIVTFFIIFVFINSALNDFNVANLANHESRIYSVLNWLMDDRDIGSFFNYGDVYRNTLIYLRYMFISIYFFMGYQLAIKKNFKIEYISNLLCLCLILNLLYSLLFSLEYRVSGFFGNPAEISSLALISVCFILFNCESKFKLIIPISTIILSVTLSAYMTLFFLLIYSIKKNKLKTNKFKTKFVVLTSLVLSFFVVNESIYEMIVVTLSEHIYVGSFINRINIWSTISYIFDTDVYLYITGFGAFPLFTDNLFWFLTSGLGVAAFAIMILLYDFIGRSELLNSIVMVVFFQGVLFPGLIMPYFISLLIFIIGYVYISGIENENIKRTEM